jgi:hypothetical protein
MSNVEGSPNSLMTKRFLAIPSEVEGFRAGHLTVGSRDDSTSRHEHVASTSEFRHSFVIGNSSFVIHFDFLLVNLRGRR